MIDIATETVLSLKEAREKLPRRRNSARPDLATMYRWAQPQGVRGVRLETIMIGGTRCTNLESLQRFFNALTAAAEAERPAPTPTEKNRKEKIEAAEKRLARAGI